MKLFKQWQIIVYVLTLAACGGGGSSAPSTKTNQSPTVNISGPTQMESGATVSLSATASDADGSIASYSWTAESGAAVTLGDNKSATLSVTAANVSADTNVKLTLTVTDNQGASTQSNQQIKILAKKTSLAISGLVTDAVVPNANVTATIRDLIFTATADANGKYTLNLSVDDAHLNDLVLIAADGGVSKPWLKLVSQLPSMNTLLTQAGDDKQLDVSENFSVNVTNVTTAEYALVARRWNEYGVPFVGVNNDLQLKNTHGAVSENAKYMLAALIKIVVDMEVSLPAGAKTTLDMVMDGGLAEELRSNISTSDSGLINQVIGTIKADPEISRPKSSYTGTYIMYLGEDDDAWEITFSSATRGEAKARFGSQSFSWQEADGVVVLNFDAPFDLHQMNNSGKWVTRALNFTVNNEAAGIKFGRMSIERKEFVNDAGDVLSTSSEMSGVRLFSTANGINVGRDKLIGEWICGYESAARKWILNSDGSLRSTNIDGANEEYLSWLPTTTGFQILRAGKKLSDIYLLSDEQVGYKFLDVTHSASLSDGDAFSVRLNTLIKPQVASVAKAKLIGAYVDSNQRIQVLSKDDIITDYSFRYFPWDYNSTENSWEIHAYQQGYITGYCDPVANKACTIFNKTVVNVLAIADDHYYLLYSKTIYSSLGQVVRREYWLETWVKLPAITAFGSWIGHQIDREYFQQTPNGVKVWRFGLSQLRIGDRSYDFDSKPVLYMLAQGRLHYNRNGIERTLELISLSDEGLVVCEYNKNEDCSKGAEIFLSNRSPGGITYKVIGGGSIEYLTLNASDPVHLYGSAAAFSIVPDQGYTVESVSGCDGKLENFTYTTAPIKSKCTITANFVKASP